MMEGLPVGLCKVMLNASWGMHSVVSAGYVTYMTYRADEMMVGAGKSVDGLKAADVESFAGVPVALLYGCYCTDGV